MPLTPLDEFNYHHRLAQTTGVSLVLFSSPGCGACRRVEQLLSTQPCPTVDQAFIVNVQQATALARQYDLFHLPSLFLYRDGHFHATVDSEASPHRLEAALRHLLSLPRQEEP